MINLNNTGDIQSDVRSLFYSKNKEKTYTHSKNVAEMNVKIAKQYGLDKDVSELCGYFHDISAVISPHNMMRYATESSWYIDEAETRYPFLLHQRISQVITRESFGVTDERILSAVGYHTTLRSNPSAYDMSLFIADKLVWDQVEEAPFHAVVSDALNESLELASLVYMEYIVEHKMILYPHTWFLEGLEYLRRINRKSS
ncbi:MAG: HD domain-containing protein [Defluviitaleaceae bacterium]|nr:HD domain-containing protein [Defluviitaleaceae bacterium]